MLRLGVNIDHVATVRNARGGVNPSPLKAAHEVQKAGAHGITVHLREDRRHIRDDDVRQIRAEIGLKLNLEMAATDEMMQIALAVNPHAVCLVPEKREELTTEGGLNVAADTERLSEYIKILKNNKIRVSLFVDADNEQISAAKRVGADIVEIHTGAYAESFHGSAKHEFAELKRIQNAVQQAYDLGLEVHAGHGLDYNNVGAIAAIPNLAELNIGHSIISEAVFSGLHTAVEKMLIAMRKP